MDNEGEGPIDNIRQLRPREQSTLDENKEVTDPLVEKVRDVVENGQKIITELPEWQQAVISIAGVSGTEEQRQQLGHGAVEIKKGDLSYAVRLSAADSPDEYVAISYARKDPDNPEMEIDITVSLSVPKKESSQSGTEQSKIDASYQKVRVPVDGDVTTVEMIRDEHDPEAVIDLLAKELQLLTQGSPTSQPES